MIKYKGNSKMAQLYAVKPHRVSIGTRCGRLAKLATARCSHCEGWKSTRIPGRAFSSSASSSAPSAGATHSTEASSTSGVISPAAARDVDAIGVGHEDIIVEQEEEGHEEVESLAATMFGDTNSNSTPEESKKARLKAMRILARKRQEANPARAVQLLLDPTKAFAFPEIDDFLHLIRCSKRAIPHANSNSNDNNKKKMLQPVELRLLTIENASTSFKSYFKS